MSVFRHAPLRQKLTWLTMICSMAALLSTAVALGTYEWLLFRRTIFQQLDTLGAVTARNSAAALASGKTEEAIRVLSALGAEPAIQEAVLYNASGAILAAYAKPGFDQAPPPAVPPDGRRKDGPELEIVTPVSDQKRFGSLLIRADVSAIGDRVAAYALVLLGTTAMSGLLTYLLSGWLSQRLVAPVQALVTAASRVKTKADYSIRVPRTESDEVGTLTDAFNDMLARVQQNEAELYRGSERLRLAIDSAEIGMWDWNLVRDEMSWNPRHYEIFGVARDTRIDSKTFFELVDPDDRVDVRTAIETAARTSTDFAVEFKLAKTAEPASYVVWRGLFLKSTAGDPLRAVGVCVDISKRRDAELRALASEQRFRAVADRAPALIWSCDTALNRDYFNRTWLTFTGRSMQDEAGAGWLTNVLADDVPRWQEVATNAVNLRDPYSVEYRLRRADGAWRWVIEIASPRLAADGAFAGYVGSCIDITARKENEAELEAYVRLRTRELEIANQELETFSYSVSHDLRAPVRAIQGFTEIAIEECQANNPAAAVERLSRVMRSADRMNKIIDAFIEMARISRSALVIAEVNLSRMAEEIVGFLRSTDPARAVDVVIAPGLVSRGDERLLRIALDNLIGNAWKFTSRTQHPRLEFGMDQRGPQAVYFVRDNGSGFDPAQAHRLFQAFERLHHASQFEGLGVGLSTVQRIVAKHRGKIWAEGAEGRGATFYFTLFDPTIPEVKLKLAVK